MRFHVVALPHTHTTAAFSACAFTQKIIGFCRMMKDRGHEVILYSGEENEAPCDEHVVCISEAERAAAVGRGHYTAPAWEPSLPHWRHFNGAAIAEIAKRKQPRDFLCLIGGRAHQPIAAAHPEMQAVEFGIGYGGTFAPYRVFESYAWMHVVYGAQGGPNPNAAKGDHWFDAVIPGYLDPARFPVKVAGIRDIGAIGLRGPIPGREAEWDIAADREHLRKEIERTEGAGDSHGHAGATGPVGFPGNGGYFLLVGRLGAGKGEEIAVEVCRRLGKRLVVAGPGTPPSGVEYAGVVGPEKRGELMAGATALFAPTTYIEPFGNVAIEAMACGTPVITTDWGAFTETVIDDVTGFRCRHLSEFIEAARKAPSLDPQIIRRHVIQNYSLDVIGAKYEAYFERLLTLWGEGWYETLA